MERSHRAHSPAGVAQGLEGAAPPAGGQFRDRRRGHQDPAGRQTALVPRQTDPNPLADFFPSSKVRLLKPRAPKAWGFFYTPRSSERSPGSSMFHRFAAMAAAAVLTACAASTPKAPPAPVAAPSPPPQLKSGL